jgi:hypothetical protein
LTKTLKLTLLQRFRLEMLLNSTPKKKKEQRLEMSIAEKVGLSIEEEELYLRETTNPFTGQSFTRLDETASRSPERFDIALDASEVTRLADLLEDMARTPSDEKHWLRDVEKQLREPAD